MGPAAFAASCSRSRCTPSALVTLVSATKPALKCHWQPQREPTGDLPVTSADPAVLEECEDVRGADDVADPAGAEGGVFECGPAFCEKGEAAFDAHRRKRCRRLWQRLAIDRMLPPVGS